MLTFNLKTTFFTVKTSNEVYCCRIYFVNYIQSVHIIKRALHGSSKIWILCSRGKNNISCHSNIKSISSRNRVISSIYFFICACLVIFFYFLQSDWLQQRAAFYDILTVVQKCYFLKTNQGVELIFELE